MRNLTTEQSSPFPWVEVSSSQIQAVRYESGVLSVRFTRGAEYSFADVPQEIYDKLLQAESVGKFFNAFIRGKFQSTKIEPKKDGE